MGLLGPRFILAQALAYFSYVVAGFFVWKVFAEVAIDGFEGHFVDFRDGIGGIGGAREGTGHITGSGIIGGNGAQ